METYQSGTRGYEGFETFTNAWRMGVKMHLTLISILVILHLLLFFGLMTASSSPERKTAVKWALAKAVQQSPFRNKNLSVRDPNGKIVRIAAHDLVKTPWAKRMADDELKKIAWIFGASCLVFLSYPLLLRFFRQRSKEQSSKRYIRGAKLISADAFNEQIEEQGVETSFPLGSISMPQDLENRTTMLIGKPGVGKSQSFRKILRTIIENKGQGIVYDHKGEYLTEFYDPDRDLIFNPLDQRSLGWNVFNELQTYMDVDAQAASLIPPSISNTNDPFWNDAARGVYSGCLHYLFQNELKNNTYLWKMLTAEPHDISNRLSKTKGGEAGYRYITQNSESSRQAESVLAVMMQYTKCFEYMSGTDGDFSITDWLKNGSGLIYITNYEDVEETLRPILSLFIDLVGRKLLSMADNLDRRIYLLLDEFGSLQRMSSIIKMLTKGRSKGASTIIGIQDDGQMEKTYGRQLLRTMDNAPGNRITFALSGETAEREAKYNIGETEYIEVERSQSMGPSDYRDGTTLREAKKRELLFLPSDISNLPDLTGIVNLRGYDFVLSRWEYEKPNPVHDAFVLRDDLVLETITTEQARMIAEAKEIEVSMPVYEPAA